MRLREKLRCRGCGNRRVIVSHQTAYQWRGTEKVPTGQAPFCRQCTDALRTGKAVWPGDPVLRARLAEIRTPMGQVH